MDMTEVKKSLSEMTDAERAEEMRRRDAEKLAARKAKFDANRFAHIEKANAENQVRSADLQKKHEEKKIPGAQATIFSTPKTQTATSELSPEVDEATKQKQNRWKLFNRNRREAEEAKEKEIEKARKEAEAAKPLPPLAGRNERPTNVRNEVQPGWAGVEKTLQQPKVVKHSSEADCSGLANSADIESGKGQKIAYIPHENPQFQTVGYGTQNHQKTNTGDGTNVAGSIISRINASAKPQPTGKPRNMMKTKVIVSESETIDAQGNVVKTITRTTVEPDGTKRVETEIVEPSTKRTFGGYK
jgi:hypothetical protein